MTELVRNPHGINLQKWVDENNKYMKKPHGPIQGIYAIQAKKDEPAGINEKRIIKVGKFNSMGIRRLWDYGNAYGDARDNNTKFNTGKGVHGAEILALIKTGASDKNSQEGGKTTADKAELRMRHKLEELDKTWLARQRRKTGIGAGRRGTERFLLTPNQVLQVMFSPHVVEAPDERFQVRQGAKRQARARTDIKEGRVDEGPGLQPNRMENTGIRRSARVAEKFK